MAQKRKIDQPELIADAALELADAHGWDSLTFTQIARKTKLKPADIEKHFADIWGILQWVLARLERDTQAEVEDYLGDDWHDNLLEILMTRFDLAGVHEEAYASLPASLRRHPKLARRFAPIFYRTMKNLLDLAGFPNPTPPAILGFGAVYAATIHTFLEDKSKDKSKTMAALDKRLDLFEKISGYLSCSTKAA